MVLGTWFDDSVRTAYGAWADAHHFELPGRNSARKKDIAVGRHAGLGVPLTSTTAAMLSTK